MAEALIATAAISTVFGAMEQAKAADQTQALAERNAQLQEMETEEAARRLEKQQAESQSLSRARAAARNVGGKSTDVYLSSIEAEDRRQLEWLKQAGASQADITRWGGRQAAAQGWAGALGTLGQGIGILGSYKW